jgi:hypothetical protein
MPSLSMLATVDPGGHQTPGSGISARRRRFAVALCVAAFYAVLAVIGTWPMAPLMASHLPHDLGDPVMSLTLLQWNATQPWFTQTWWNGVGFYPMPDTMTYSDPRLGVSLISTPVIWLTGSPIVGYNVAFIASFALSGLGAHALVFTLTRSHAAGFIAGCAFAFAPFRAAHLAHLEVLQSFWMPVGLLCLHRWLETRAARWLVGVAVACAAQGLFCAYYLPMFGVLVGAWLLWFAAGRVAASELVAVVAAPIAGALTLLPLFLRFGRAHEAAGFFRGVNEIQAHSADVSGLWSAAPDLRLWPSFFQASAEGYLFPGLMVVLLVALYAVVFRSSDSTSIGIRRMRRTLAAVGAVAVCLALVPLIFGPVKITLAGITLSLSRVHKSLSFAIPALMGALLLNSTVLGAIRRRSPIGFYMLAAALMFVMALGPVPQILGRRFFYKPPYAWLMLLPGFDRSFRAPARFGMLMALALAVTAGLVWVALRRRWPALGARWAAVASVGLILAEGWVAPITAVIPPHQIGWPKACAGLPRLELPLWDIERDAAAQYRALLDHTRSVNGLSGFTPSFFIALNLATRAKDDDALAAIAEHGPLCISVDESRVEGAPMTAWLASQRIVRPLGRRDERTFALLRQTKRSESPRSGDGVPIVAARSDPAGVTLSSIIDGRPDTAWDVTTSGAAPQLELTLGCDASVRTIELSQSDRFFPRTLAIDASPDGSRWEQIWQGTTGGLIVRAAIRAPRRAMARVPAVAPRARALRLRATALGSESRWVIVDAIVRGECDALNQGRHAPRPSGPGRRGITAFAASRPAPERARRRRAPRWRAVSPGTARPPARGSRGTRRGR